MAATGQPLGGAARPLLGGLARRRAAGGRPDHLAALMAPFDGRRAPRADERDADRRRLVRVLRRARHAGQRERRRAGGAATAQRVDRGGRPAYDKIMQGHRRRCAPRTCRSPRCAWSPTPARGWPRSSTRTSSTWAATSLGINIEEQEGVNARVERASTATAVRAFWAELVGGVARRSAHPRARDRVDAAVRRRRPRRHRRRPAAAAHSTRSRRSPPTAAWSCSRPELAGFTDRAVRRVRVRQRADARRWPRSWTAPAEPAGWIAEYLTGVEACRERCPYFGFCGGAHAANRYFEHGSFDGTETNHCRNSKIRLLEGVLDHAGTSR